MQQHFVRRHGSGSLLNYTHTPTYFDVFIQILHAMSYLDKARRMPLHAAGHRPAGMSSTVIEICDARVVLFEIREIL